MRPFAPRFSVALALAVMTVLLLSARVPHAEAHALAVSSTPAPNSKLAQPPKTIDIEFSEAVEPSVSTIELWDQQGKQIALGKPQFYDDPKRMSIDIPVTLESAIYTVIWRNLSKVDGHTWQGSFPFTVLGSNGQEPGGSAAAVGGNLGAGRKDLPSVLDTTARWSVLLAVSVIIGGIWFALGVVRPSLRELDSDAAEQAWETSRTALLVSGVIACLLVVEGTLLQLSVKAQDFGGLDAAHTVLFDTRFGNYLIARLVLAVATFACFMVAWRAGSRGTIAALWVAFAGGIGLLMTHSLVSHAASGDGAVTAVTIDALHLAAAAFWLGALIHVLFTLPRWLELLQTRARTVFLARAFHRFSIAATISVALLLASGVLSATLQAPTWSALYDSNWGRSLLAKLGLTLLLLAAGGLNAYWLRPQVVDAVLRPGASESSVSKLHRRLLNMIRVEALIGAAVLAAAAALIQLQTPRDSSLASAFASSSSTTTQTSSSVPVQQGKPFTQTRETGVIQLFLDIEPAKVGENDFTIGVGSEFGNPPKVIQARLQFDHQSESTGQSRLVLDDASSSAAQLLYKASGANLSLPGEWKITANLRIEGQDDLNETFQINLPGAQTAPAPSSSIWDWPLRSRFAEAMLALALVSVAAVVVVQVRGSRRR